MSGVLQAPILAKALQTLPIGALVQCNDVKNLAIHNDQGVYIGYIDFMTGNVEYLHETGMAYTVLLMYPDHVTSNYGQETYLAHVVATSGSEAIAKAQLNAGAENQCNGEDFFPVLCIAGHHDEVDT